MQSPSYFFVTCFIFLHTLHAETVTCPKDRNCQCESNDPCTMNCASTDYCKGSSVQLTCKSGQPCTVVCSGSSSCMDATININGATSLTLECTNKDTCKAATVNCPPGGDCAFECGGEGSTCQDTTVNLNGASSFICTGTYCNWPSMPDNYSPAPTVGNTVPPTTSPTKQPTSPPSKSPTDQPTTASPTNIPSESPTKLPTGSPTEDPSISPTKHPSVSPTKDPTTKSPTSSPTHDPSESPTETPTTSPTKQPTTKTPSTSPTDSPTEPPTDLPSSSPSNVPSETPTKSPSSPPTKDPSTSPTETPVTDPTQSPSQDPSESPTETPTTSPTKQPTTKTPSSSPTDSPTEPPTNLPSSSPTNVPSETPTKSPSSPPTKDPSTSPTETPVTDPTQSPSQDPSTSPTKSPSEDPSTSPTKSPSDDPSTSPTKTPSSDPTKSPSAQPTTSPEAEPVTTDPTTSPTEHPTQVTGHPTKSPESVYPTTESPTEQPSASPMVPPETVSPTESPTTHQPTLSPSHVPTARGPTTESPTLTPSASPTEPTGDPTETPTESPSTNEPTATPTHSPTTSTPTESPTASPAVAPVTAGTVYYVNPTNTNPTIDGTSWATAFTRLEDALSATTRGIDEIWLIGGATYVPDTTSRSACFTQVQVGITIYGGFVGTESSPIHRPADVHANPSILSGDIGVAGNALDNCYHVFTYLRRLTLDGVIIQGGYADMDDAQQYQSQENVLHRYGGALINAAPDDRTDIYLNNIIFRYNAAINGGALFFKQSVSTAAFITNCVFERNYAIASDYEGGYGGAIYTYWLAEVNVTDTVFLENQAAAKAGAVYIDYGGVFNCVQCRFQANRAEGYGGAIFAEDRNSQTEGTFPRILQSEFVRNSAGVDGGAICLFNGPVITLTDNTFADNRCDRFGGALALISNVQSIESNNAFSNNTANGDALTNDVYAEEEIVWADVDRALTFDVNEEMSRIQTIYDTIYPDTDKFAWDSSSITVCYVKQVNANTNNGLSWNTAYVDIQDCINYLSIAGGGEVWVQTGTYTPTEVVDWKINVGDTQPKYRSFIMYDNIRLYGGFVGTETNRNQRDFVSNPTYLSCQLEATLYCHQILIAADDTIVDGFIFKDAGLGNIARRRLAFSTSVQEVLSSTSSFRGAGVFSNSTNIVVANSIFVQLFAIKGAGAYCIGVDGNENIKSPTFINVAFLGNRANNRGGAISGDVQCNFQCEYCTFDSNSCAKKGGAIYLDFDSDPTFKDSIFRNNYALESGGCIAADGNSLVTMYEPAFYNNSARWEGGCLYAGSGVNYGIDQGYTIYSEQHQTLDGLFVDNSIMDQNPGRSNVYLWPFAIFTFVPAIGANIMIFIIDDMLYTAGWSESAPVGVNLNNNEVIEYLDVPTPNIDRIRGEGLVIPRSYTGGPLCAPSRFSLLTGRHPVRCEWAIRRTVLASDGTQGTDVTIANLNLQGGDQDANLMRLLKSGTVTGFNNYYTGHIGKWHLTTTTDNGYQYGCSSLGTTPNATLYEQCSQIVADAGFDFVSAVYHGNVDENVYFSHNPEWMVSEAQKFIDTAVQNSQPFFLYFASTLLHDPDIATALNNFDATSTPKGTLTGDEIPNYSEIGMRPRSDIWQQASSMTAFTNLEKKMAAGAIWIDDALGAMISYLEQKDILNNTFIVIVNDHGMGGKGLLYEHGIRQFQYIRYPPLFGTNGYVLPEDFIVSTMDLAAVITEITNIDTTNYVMDGVSWLQDAATYMEAVDNNQVIDYDVNPPSCCAHRIADMYNSHALVTRDYKYIWRATQDKYQVGRFVTLYACINDTEQLYDLGTDPNEQHNLLRNATKKEAHKGITFQMQYLMIAYQRDIACQADNKDLCLYPNVTYIAPGYPTPAPSEPSDFTCSEVINHTATWNRVRRFNEQNAGPVWLARGEEQVIANYPQCVTTVNLEYAYRFTYQRPVLTLDMLVCCPAGETFGASWTGPTGYTRTSAQASNVVVDNGNNVTSSDAFGVKEVIVVAIVALLILIGSGCGWFVWRKRKQTEKKDKEIAAMLRHHRMQSMEREEEDDKARRSREESSGIELGTVTKVAKPQRYASKHRVSDVSMVSMDDNFTSEDRDNSQSGSSSHEPSLVDPMKVTPMSIVVEQQDLDGRQPPIVPSRGVHDQYSGFDEVEKEKKEQVRKAKKRALKRHQKKEVDVRTPILEDPYREDPYADAVDTD